MSVNAIVPDGTRDVMSSILVTFKSRAEAQLLNEGLFTDVEMVLQKKRQEEKDE